MRKKQIPWELAEEIYFVDLEVTCLIASLKEKRSEKIKSRAKSGFDILAKEALPFQA